MSHRREWARGRARALALAGALTGATAHAAAAQAGATALIIANSGEENPHAHNDAQAFARFVIETRGVLRERVHRLDNVDATAIGRTIEGLAAYDHLVVYFSGEQIDGSEHPVRGLVTASARAKAGNIELFIETSDGQIEDASAWADSSPSTGKRTVLVATSPGERALRDEKTRLGWFTLRLVEALHGWADDDGDTHVSAAEAKAYLDDSLTTGVIALGGAQTAMLAGHSDAILTNRPKRSPTKPGESTSREPAWAAAPSEDGQTAWGIEQALGLPRSERRIIQSGLAEQGFDVGPIDGIFGPRTRAAISAWEARQQRTPNGHLDAEEARALLAAGRDATERLEPPQTPPVASTP